MNQPNSGPTPFAVNIIMERLDEHNTHHVHSFLHGTYAMSRHEAIGEAVVWVRDKHPDLKIVELQVYDFAAEAKLSPHIPLDCRHASTPMNATQQPQPAGPGTLR